MSLLSETQYYIDNGTVANLGKPYSWNPNPPTTQFVVSRDPVPDDGTDHTEEKQPAVFVLEMKTNHE